MTVVITPPVEKLAGLVVQTFAEAKNADQIVDHDLAREAAMAYADAIVIVLRGGVDASEGQQDEVEVAEGLLETLDAVWEATRATNQSQVRRFQDLHEALIDRLTQVVDINETAAEVLALNAREREIRLNLARPLIVKFATAAYRWLGPDSSDTARYAAEQRADVLSDVLVGLVPADVLIDPMRHAQDARNTARSAGVAFTPKTIIDRLNGALA
jgi:hypothetical protein